MGKEVSSRDRAFRMREAIRERIRATVYQCYSDYQGCPHLAAEIEWSDVGRFQFSCPTCQLSCVGKADDRNPDID